MELSYELYATLCERTEKGNKTVGKLDHTADTINVIRGNLRLRHNLAEVITVVGLAG